MLDLNKKLLKNEWIGDDRNNEIKKYLEILKNNFSKLVGIASNEMGAEELEKARTFEFVIYNKIKNEKEKERLERVCTDFLVKYSKPANIYDRKVTEILENPENVQVNDSVKALMEKKLPNLIEEKFQYKLSDEEINNKDADKWKKNRIKSLKKKDKVDYMCKEFLCDLFMKSYCDLKEK